MNDVAKNPYNRKWYMAQAVRNMEVRLTENIESLVAVYPDLNTIGLNMELMVDIVVDSLADSFRDIRLIRNDEVKAEAMRALESNVTDYLQEGLKPID